MNLLRPGDAGLLPPSFPRRSQRIQPSEKSDDPHCRSLSQFPQLPRGLAQLIFHVEQSIVNVPFLPLRLAEAVFRLLPLAFRVLDECAKCFVDFEQLAFHFGPEIASRILSVRLADSGVRAMGGHSKRSSRAESTTQRFDDQHQIAPALARAIIEVVLCPLSSGTKMTFPP
jgi:hypothetical protein